MAKVTLKGVTKKFGNVVAVRNENLKINDGEFLVLLGPSGCGKTTTLRLVAGLEEPTEGEIYIGDKLVNNIPPKDRDIAMVFQNYALYPHMNVYQNISFGLRLRKTPKDEIDQRVKKAAEMLGIEELLKRKPKELSGGQKQRVALARAVVRNPKVYLMDEPLSNLDAKLRVQTRGELIKLHKRLGVTTVYVTHDQVEAMTLGDRVVVMNEGEIQQEGKPKEVFDNPVNRFVAGFVGTPPMNFVNVQIVEKNKKIYAVSEGFELKIVDAHQDILAKEGYIGKNMIMGIRPKDLFSEVEVKKDGKMAMQPFKVLIDFVELMGSETFIHFRLGDGDIKFVARASSDHDYAMGDTVMFYIDPFNIHLFDEESLKTII
ncbi:MAG: ABC transporter ATP-binding protein [Caldisericota bacterium]|nr:ABC transporter ATP-binding protein [Caldisericota bacterium]